MGGFATLVPARVGIGRPWNDADRPTERATQSHVIALFRDELSYRVQIFAGTDSEGLQYGNTTGKSSTACRFGERPWSY